MHIAHKMYNVNIKLFVMTVSNYQFYVFNLWLSWQMSTECYSITILFLKFIIASIITIYIFFFFFYQFGIGGGTIYLRYSYIVE